MKVLSRVLQWSWLACIPGGALWALSPRGVHLSEIKFKTAGVFWKLFPSAPLLLAAGSILFVIAAGRDRMEPVWGTVPFAVGALCGLVSVSSALESFGGGPLDLVRHRVDLAGHLLARGRYHRQVG